MKEKNLEDSILKTIEKENIVPRSKEYFVIKNWIFTSLCGLSFVFAIIVLIFNILFLSRLDIDILSSFSILKTFRIVYPVFFWLVLSIGFGFLTFQFFKRTRDGYKVEKKYLWIVIPTLILILFSFGWFLESRLDLTSNMVKNPVLREVSDPRYLIWNNPAEGRLAGEILEVKDRDILIVDIDNKEWEVDISKAALPKKIVVVEKNEIKISGTQTGENTFVAERIMPWGQGRMGCLQENGCGRRSIR